jgi:aminomethyltransferase
MIQTPFNSLHSNLRANFSDYCGWALPSDYGDTAAENRALYQHSAAFDLSSFGKISISGDDASILIHNLLCSRTDSIEDGTWSWGIVADGCGRLLDIVRVGRLGQSYILFTSPRSRKAVLQQIHDCVDNSQLGGLKISDQTEKTGMLGVYGPGAVDALDRIIPLGIAEMQPGEIKSISMFMMSLTLVRGSWMGLDGIEVLSGTSACKLASGAIEKYHKQQNIVPAGMEAFEIALSESSLPLMITDQQQPETLAPSAYGLGMLIDPAKKTPGVSAFPANRQLVGIRTEDRAHTHKDIKIQFGGIEIGWSDRIVWSEKLGATIGLAMVDSEMADLAEEVQITGQDIAIGGQITALPLEQSIAAGIYRV